MQLGRKAMHLYLEEKKDTAPPRCPANIYISRFTRLTGSHAPRTLHAQCTLIITSAFMGVTRMLPA